MIKIKLGELVNAEKEGAFVEVAKLDLKLKLAIRVKKIIKNDKIRSIYKSCRIYRKIHL